MFISDDMMRNGVTNLWTDRHRVNDGQTFDTNNSFDNQSINYVRRHDVF